MSIWTLPSSLLDHVQQENKMDPASEMHSALTMGLSWLPFLIYVLVLYFFMLRPLHRLSATIKRLTDAIEKRGA
jgi:hypothetical protein